MDRQIDHKTMRVIIGVIAVSLSPVVYLLSGLGNDLYSVSGSYWTDSQDIFVGDEVTDCIFHAGTSTRG